MQSDDPVSRRSSGRVLDWHHRQTLRTTDREPMTQANPGSPAAISQGCLCPIMDNHQGNGRPSGDGTYVFIHSGSCPMHGFKSQPHSTTTIDSSGIQR